MRPDTAASSGPSTISAPLRARRLAARALRLAKLQWQIALLRAKITLVRFTLFLILSALALLLALVSILCLFIALFQGLAAFLPMPLVWLIFGSILAAAATTIMFFALRLLRAVNTDEEAVP